ncbi:hypothetical protein A2442_03275 [Candidatus Campbellbacteria bacterium RIFOXYC2_FULL_35_25]|uniref:Phospholipid/glycerol acyltransferase domain-containing protein n=1 Tax=Candidatus Campbellbacteria bacterium RIFOXYC2_FULL_35_25 TaxID=1797582 RepID=A0A1F5EJ96_9BACT|nr:MAG: hypothetical protein A2442_03275 [Candidatus Campbellbacteria bacterium RIFOXYC2_FULL_35_25]
MKKIYYIAPWVLQTTIWIPTRIFFKLFCSYKVKGLKNLKELEKNCFGTIFAVNHSSELDPIMIPASLPFFSCLMPMFYVSREQKFYVSSGWRQHIYGGLFFRLWGAHNAYTGKKDYDIALRHHIQILKDGKSVCIFPEGRKTRDGEIAEGRPGVSFLAYRTKSPVVPVRIRGLYKPHTQRDFLGRKKIEVIFGQPIYPNDLFGDKKEVSIEEFKNAREVIMDKIREL